MYTCPGLTYHVTLARDDKTSGLLDHVTTALDTRLLGHDGLFGGDVHDD